MKFNNYKLNRVGVIEGLQLKKSIVMKNILVLTLILTMALSLTSCEDWLTVKPESDLVLDDFWKNESQVNQMLAACYRSMLEDDFVNRVMVWGELRSDNVLSSSDTPESMYRLINLDFNSKNGWASWTPMYRTINYCNNWLYFAPGVIDLDPNYTRAKYLEARAEVLSVRALSYFYLVRAFREVPWIDTPSIDDAQDYNVKKAKEDDILDNITADLQEALQYVNPQYDIEEYNKGRVTPNMINALLADISLWRNDYNATVNYCNKVLDDNNLELVAGEDLLTRVFYLGNSRESIFELNYSLSNIQNNTAFDFLLGAQKLPFWRFPITLNQTGGPFHYEEQSGIVEGGDTDTRKYDFLMKSDEETIYPFKYVGLRMTDDNAEKVTISDYTTVLTDYNFIVYRLADIILMKAEALAEMGNRDQEAMELVNQTFLRSNYTGEVDSLSLTVYTGKVKDLVLRERHREFMWEGKRWFDLVRMARRDDNTSGLVNFVMKKFGGSGSNLEAKMSVIDALFMPIHYDELVANPALVQNPFYLTNTGGSSGN